MGAPASVTTTLPECGGNSNSSRLSPAVRATAFSNTTPEYCVDTCSRSSNSSKSISVARTDVAVQTRHNMRADTYVLRLHAEAVAARDRATQRVIIPPFGECKVIALPAVDYWERARHG